MTPPRPATESAAPEAPRDTVVVTHHLARLTKALPEFTVLAARLAAWGATLAEVLVGGGRL
ncbi:MAG: hypothetical protein ACRDQZ_21395, partial [Mycobacteriales bacterium]